MAGATAAVSAAHVHEVYKRMRETIGDEHSAEIDADVHAALVTAIVLHFRHGLSVASAFRAVRALVGAGGHGPPPEGRGHQFGHHFAP